MPHFSHFERKSKSLCPFSTFFFYFLHLYSSPSTPPHWQQWIATLFLLSQPLTPVFCFWPGRLLPLPPPLPLHPLARFLLPLPPLPSLPSRRFPLDERVPPPPKLRAHGFRGTREYVKMSPIPGIATAPPPQGTRVYILVLGPARCRGGTAPATIPRLPPLRIPPLRRNRMWRNRMWIWSTKNTLIQWRL